MSNHTLAVQRLWDLEEIKQLWGAVLPVPGPQGPGRFKDLFTVECVHHLS
jgi:hypothetical protein